MTYLQSLFFHCHVVVDFDFDLMLVDCSAVMLVVFSSVVVVVVVVDDMNCCSKGPLADLVVGIVDHQHTRNICPVVEIDDR